MPHQTVDSIAMSSVRDEEDVFVFPASFAQQRLWFLDQVEPGSAVYNIPKAFRLTGPLDAAVLVRALNEIVARHEALRTIFAAQDGEALQAVLPSVTLDVPTVDLRDIGDEATRESTARRLMAEEARTPFDLAVGLLIRATILRLGDDDHIFLLTAHHSIADGYSLAVLFTELSALYKAFVTGAPSPLEPVPIQYADYAMWQREWFQGETLERGLRYWRERLAGPLPVLALPTDRTRPAVQTSNGDFRMLSLDRQTVDRLHVVARGAGASLFMVMLAAFNALLLRYTGQDDILLGSPIANRDRPELEAAIGFYTNTVVYRTDLSGDPTFRELLHRVRAVAMEVFSYQDLPFEKVVEAVHPHRELSYSPVFQAMFAMQKSPDNALELPGMTFRAVPTASPTSRFDLMFELLEVPSGLQGFLEFNTDLFDTTTAERMLEHFRELVLGVAENPDAQLSELPLLTPSERRRVLSESNGERRTFGGPGTIHGMFAAEASRRPDEVAVEFEGRSLTYAQLDRQANQLAHHLRALGVTPDASVGVCLERGPAMVVALLGALKAGAAYLPMDPAFPPDRLAFMLGDAGVKVLLTENGVRDAFPEHTAAIVCLDSDWEPSITPLPETAPMVDVEPAALAYIIYTSGSTGKPKGVEVTHGAVVNFLNSMREVPGVHAGDRLVAVTTLSFDIAGLELYLPLVTGGRVIIASRETASDGIALLELMRTADASVMQATPATWRLLLDAGWMGTPGLRILVGGEAVPRDLANQLAERAAEVWNMYGPTETTIWSTTQRLTTGDGPVFIGRPIANTEVYVLDRHRQPVPAGVAGELYIGGAGVARGYRGRPDLTAERFVAHPFVADVGASDGARLYRTGDLVRFARDPRSEGALEFIGRLDFQVKVRGFRIELGEIETALLAHESVNQAIVAVRDDRLRDKRLVGYVTFRDGETVTQSELRRHLRQSLPEYMVPSLIQELDALPLTRNGKVDRNSLPDPFAQSDATDEEFSGPSTEMQQFIADVWRDVLGVARVGTRDNFFELGGHSLLSMRVMARIEQKIGRRLNPRAMVLQTLEQIASEAESLAAR